MLNRTFVSNNILFFSIILFVILFITIQVLKPSLLYHKDGSLKKFGIGFKNKTIIPMWLITIVLAILSYTGVLYYLVIPRIKYSY